MQENLELQQPQVGFKEKIIPFISLLALKGNSANKVVSPFLGGCTPWTAPPSITQP